MEEDSIYTIHRTHSYSKPGEPQSTLLSEEEEEETYYQKKPKKPSAFRYKRKYQIEEGPWYMNLKNVLNRQDLSKEKHVQKYERRKLARKIRNEKSKKKRKGDEEEEEDGEEEPTESEMKKSKKKRKVNDEDVEEDEEQEESEMTHTSYQNQPEPSTPSFAEEQRTEPINDENQDRKPFPEELNHLLPSSSLLGSIHESVSRFYTNQNLMKPKPIRAGRPRKDKTSEPKLMLKTLHGSSLIAIGILLEEIAKEEVSKVDQPMID